MCAILYIETKKGENIMKLKISTLSMLGIIFVVLKLCGVISWSWWWVLCPFWLPAFFIGVIVLYIASFCN